MNKLVKMTYPSWFYPALICMDYSGLKNEDFKLLNTILLNDGVLFSDCKKTSEEYPKLIAGVYCMVMDFYFERKAA